MLVLTAALTLTVMTAESPENAKEAATLFDKARVALKAGRYAEACPTFEKSQALDPALGTLLNLAACYEKQNKAGSAYSKYLEAMAWSQRINDADREAYAKKASDALKPKVSWLAISASEDVEVKLDTQTLRVTPSVLMVPIDSGLHALSADKTGYEKWSTNIEVTKPGETITQRVPQLKPPAPAVAPTPAPVAVATVTPPPTPAAATDAKIEVLPWAPLPATNDALTPPPVVVANPSVVPASSTRGAGVALIVGGALVTVGGAVGLGWSFATYNTLQTQRINVLPPATYGVSEADFERIKWVYPLSWAAVGVGATSVIVGAVLASKKAPVAVTPVVSPNGGAVTVSGHF